jgi:Rrf2 family protein
MMPYSKTAQTAIAAISMLAECHNKTGSEKLSSLQIARERGLPQPVVAKVLTILAQGKLVIGSPGPGGGYSLARPPAKITLYEVIALFDRVDRDAACPFGPGYCGVGPQCPLHLPLARLREELTRFLQSSTLETFADSRPAHDSTSTTVKRRK